MMSFKNIITAINKEGGGYMKKMALIVVAIAVAVYVMPAFAGGAGCASKASEKSSEQTLFQKASDEVNAAKVQDRFKVKAVPPEEVKVFQNLSDGIKEGSAKAKNSSLR
jgi:hypothetical protein